MGHRLQFSSLKIGADQASMVDSEVLYIIILTVVLEETIPLMTHVGKTETML